MQSRVPLGPGKFHVVVLVFSKLKAQYQKNKTKKKNKQRKENPVVNSTVKASLTSENKQG